MDKCRSIEYKSVYSSDLLIIKRICKVKYTINLVNYLTLNTLLSVSYLTVVLGVHCTLKNSILIFRGSFQASRNLD